MQCGNNGIMRLDINLRKLLRYLKQHSRPTKQLKASHNCGHKSCTRFDRLSWSALLGICPFLPLLRHHIPNSFNKCRHHDCLCGKVCLWCFCSNSGRSCSFFTSNKLSPLQSLGDNGFYALCICISSILLNLHVVTLALLVLYK